MKRCYIPVLSVAGSDSSGGAGIQADLKTISSIGCYGMTAITALTAQNTCGVLMSEGVRPEMVKMQLEAVWDDITPMAVKTGMLYDTEIVDTVTSVFKERHVENLVVDPVMISTSGFRLIEQDAVNAMIEWLFPLAHLVTPNRQEAEALTGLIEPFQQAKALIDMGCKNVLIKGGDSSDALVKTDLLLLDGEKDPIMLKADAVNSKNTHGTGCTLSSAIACYLALGFDLESAVSKGKLYVTRALEAGNRIVCGHGHGPVNHLFSPRRMKTKIL